MQATKTLQWKWNSPLAWTLVGTGCALLALRPLLWSHARHQTADLFALFIALLLVATRWPVTHQPQADPSKSAKIACVGVLAFAFTKFAVSAHSPVPASVPFVALNGFAAVAEEAFFRRFLYALLLTRYGVTFSLAASAVLFALVHVPVYGLWVFPIDLAAGLLFGWQRQATGSWKVPAVTHVFANVMVVA